ENIPGAHGQSVTLPDCRSNDETDAEIQVLFQLSEDRTLLVILLSEPCDVRPDDTEEFRDDGRDADKVMGTRFSFPAAGNGRHRDDCVESLGVHRCGGWLEAHIHAFLPAQRPVL